MTIFFSVLTLIGGLCLFMFGMSLMGDSLERAAGNKLQALLAKFTNNKMAGFATGLAVTAVIQSSSATTVMVVGFVNSSLMTLRQAINVIMGANIGTTITAWILSLDSIPEEAGLVLKFFKPDTFVPILGLIGLGLYMFSKSSRKKDIGTILLGFATLMFGMTIMSDATDNEQIRNIISNVFGFFGTNSPLGWFAPAVAILAGAIFTAVIQSSSASVGILQTLANTAAAAAAKTGVASTITNGVVLPIIMGQNIGTCITAVLSSAGANKNGKRTAIVHLSFNIIGTTIMLLVYYILRIIFASIGNDFFLGWGANAFSIATMHTIFNVATTAILLPSSRLLEKIAYKIMPKTKDEKQQKLVLDEILLQTPAAALSVCHKATATMAIDAVGALNESLDSFFEYTPQRAKNIRDIEDKTDHYEDVIGTYLVKLSSHQIGDKSSDEAAKYLRVINDFERISDHAVNLIESKEEMNDKKIDLSNEAKEEVKVISSALREILTLSLNAFVNNDLALAKKVEPLEQVIDNLKEELRARHIYRLQQGNCSIEAGFVWSDILTNIERTADHCSNIAACIIDTAHNRLDLHEVVKEMKESSTQFADLYKKYTAKYSLPQQ
ncbi:MAG: Na/Pi cotransporter family protein [Clostridia bacterium]|nr:Na/Pi cotransporter family protein [Clostridia bacterium]